MGMDRSAGISDGGEAATIETNDVVFHCEKRQGLTPRNKNADGDASIFDYLSVHLIFRTYRTPAVEIGMRTGVRVTFARDNRPSG